MERVIPVLQIDNYDQAVDFYVTRLGFTILFEHRHEPGFPVYMVVKHGNLLMACPSTDADIKGRKST